MKYVYRAWLKRSAEEDDFERIKVRLIFAFSAIGILISLIYWSVHFIVIFNVPRILFIILPVLLVAGCFLLLLKVHHFWVAHFIIFSFWISFAIGSYYSGGIFSIVLPWLCLMPVMANLILNYKSSWGWFLISFVTIVYFSVVGDNLPVIKYNNGPWRAVLSVIGLCLILFFFTSLFDRARYRLLLILKDRNEDLEKNQQVVAEQNRQIDFVNRELQKKVKSIENINNALERHWNTLLEVSKDKNVNFGHLKDALQYLLRVTAESLDVHRVSVWRYSKDPECIKCLFVYHKGVFLEGEMLTQNLNPMYFEAIRREKIITARNVYTHPDTKDFAESYLKPLNIFSLMDAPFFLDGELGGVLCCEQQNAERDWCHEDIIFATSMADIVSLTYRSAARREYEKNIRNLGNEILKQNELLKLKSEEIEIVNQSLERRVKERTEDLQQKNKQLAEYAFINSHLLRAPLARIMGLVELLQKETPEFSANDIIPYLDASSRELDNVVKKINQAIEDESVFNREDLTNSKSSASPAQNTDPIK
jgi:GAF domain